MSSRFARRALSTMTAKAPLVAIVGATGTGKSQLAVELASRFNGEIINGDAMQLYSGLPIITNKIPLEERKGVPHHLLGCIGLDEQTWTVGKFVSKALDVVEGIRSRGRLPILVGGTHYYTQSLLFNETLMEGQGEEGDEDGFLATEEKEQRWPILQEPTEAILEKLRQVDPVMADRWHPNDRRKIQRSLEIWLQTGKTASETYEEQQKLRTANGNDTTDRNGDNVAMAAGLRFPTLVLWVHADPDTLRSRLDDRVDTMVNNGLLTEIASLDTFQKQQEHKGAAVDRTRGIWVSIGYKEFKAYQDALISGTRSPSELEKLKQLAIEQTKAATRQYAKRQVRWIRIKLIHALRSKGCQNTLYLLDASNIARWEESVLHTSTELVDRFLAGSDLPDPASLCVAAAEQLVPKRNYDMSQRRDLWERRVCEACSVVIVTESDWSSHVNSKGHKYAMRKFLTQGDRAGGGEVPTKDSG